MSEIEEMTIRMSEDGLAVEEIAAYLDIDELEVIDILQKYDIL